jgi:type I restriction enzyme R subunit
MPHAYTEDQRVEQPAIGLFAELGWATVSASEEPQTLRRSRGPLLPRLRSVLVSLAAAEDAGSLLPNHNQF